MDNETKYVLVTGATGQLGYDIVDELTKKGIPCIGVGSANLDITNDEAVSKFFDTHKICFVYHCAAYTKVDDAETNIEVNHSINVNGTKNIVVECDKYKIPMTFFSTDYVFGGDGDKPFKEDDKCNPLCEYARAKYLAEKEVMKLSAYFILRISWVFGKNGNNFIKTMLRLSETRKELKVVSDQIGSPTYTRDIAKLAVSMLDSKKYGIYHVTNEGYVSWADFARTIFEMTGKDVNVYDVTTEEYGAKALRPKNSRLDKSKLEDNGFEKLPSWEDALKRYLKEIGY